VNRYTIRPKADLDLEDQAFYYAVKSDGNLGNRFLAAACETFALLATQPNMGWTYRSKDPGLRRLRVFRVKGFEKMLVLYQPVDYGVEILRVVHASRNLQAFLHREWLE
jgi:toxin ParE1/3/4